ncbi:hypothetical protein ZIOFF_017984 [Zingiber officinale]|uniref:Uncharacterized protein n=1 Tax=Zingiber officinale TaxID=94328 RepID=A0A8J5LQ13_ZINOF|nr:hypothetical protein ZIOFF_017984 [Zingiber officinale]
MPSLYKFSPPFSDVSKVIDLANMSTPMLPLRRYYDTYLPFLLEACNDDTADVRQAAVYGVGVCAEFGSSVFRPLVGEALFSLNNVIGHPDALQSDNVMAYDNVVSALGKICQFHRDGLMQRSCICIKTCGKRLIKDIS